MRKCVLFFKRETVLCLAALAALISAFWVPPCAEYLGYWDLRTLAQLFCLMLVVAGFQSLGLFTALIQKLLAITKNTRQLAAILILICFFASMFITNDVALITFVPFAILALRQAGQGRHMIFVLVMQTIAANLGIMLTPLGNPQNLYLYGIAHLSLSGFLGVMAPVSALSLVLILLLLLRIPRQALPKAVKTYDFPPVQRGKAAAFGLLFIVCLLCVLHLLPYSVMLMTVTAGVVFFNPSLLRRVDYSLLATFVAFFIFVGNLKQLPAVYDFLQGTMLGREMLVSALLSQCISNVPAAVLLSGFTEHYTQLLLGVNIGGLGTLIASMASLISFKLYCREQGRQRGRYLLVFTLLNAGFFVILYGATWIWNA